MIDLHSHILPGIDDGVRTMDEGLAVLWATHLIDEVLPQSEVVVLHLGRILAAGPRDQVVADSGAGDIREAFLRLTRDGEAKGGAKAPETVA